MAARFLLRQVRMSYNSIGSLLTHFSALRLQLLVLPWSAWHFSQKLSSTLKVQQK
jgi:hypothetical protein